MSRFEKILKMSTVQNFSSFNIIIKTYETLVQGIMSTRLSVRLLLRSARCSARSKPLSFTDLKSIKLRSPIVPTHKNFDVSPDHPLWAFFPDGNKSDSCYRETGDLDVLSRPWDLPALRRKSFDDLHKLWYLILKERNILAREVRLAESFNERSTHAHNDLDDKLTLTQKRIKQVLIERQVAYERVQTFTESQKEYLSEFEERYINADQAEIVSYNEKLVRLQYAFFGIHPQLEDYNLEEDINVKFVEGLSYVANLKLRRYLSQNPQKADEIAIPLNGVVEELPFLLRDVEEAIQEVQELRKTGTNIKLHKVEIFPFLRNALAETIEKAYAEQEQL